MKNITKKKKQLLFWMAQDHYTAWKDILSKKQISNYILRHLSYSITCYQQLEQVRLGIQRGLDDEQIKAFTKRGLSPKQMAELRFLCEDGMDYKLVSLMANPRYSVEIMKLIEHVFLDGYAPPITSVRLITNPKFNFSQSEEIASNILSRLPLNKIEFYAKPEFTAEQMHSIFYGLANNLTIEQVSLYAKPEFNANQMSVIAQGLLDMPNSIEKIKLYANPKFNANQMSIIHKGLTFMLPEEHLMLYANPCFSYEQMQEIFYAHLYDLTIEEIKTFANPKYSAEQMSDIRENIVCTKQSHKLLSILKEIY